MTSPAARYPQSHSKLNVRSGMPLLASPVFSKKIVYLFACLACLTISFNLAAIIAVIPNISREFRLPDFFVSKIISFYLLPYGAAALIYAPLTRYFAYAQIYFWSLIIYATASLICAFTSSIDVLFWARAVTGIAAAGVIPLGLMLIGEFFEKNVRGKLVGFFFSCTFIGSLAGMLTSGFCHWRWLFYIPAILGLFLVVVCYLMREGALAKVHGVRINYRESLSNIRIFRVLIFIFVLSFLYHGVNTWYGIYLDRVYQLNKLHISLILAMTLVVSIFGQIAGGYLSDIKGRVWTCSLGVIGLGVSTMLLWTQHSLIMVTIILSLIALFWTIGHNGTSTILTDFEEEHRAVLASLNSSVRFVSAGLGFLVSGVFTRQSFGLTFLAIGILIILLSTMITYSLKQR